MVTRHIETSHATELPLESNYNTETIVNLGGSPSNFQWFPSIIAAPASQQNENQLQGPTGDMYRIRVLLQRAI